MNKLLKYSGLLLIIIAVIILGVYSYANLVSNTLLAISILMLVGGLAVHIIMGKILD